MFEMRLRNFERFGEELAFLSQNYPHEVEKVLEDIGKSMVSMSKNRTPQRTGELKRNWKKTQVVRENGTFKIKVYNDDYYAPFVEYGHKIVKNGEVVGHVRGTFMFTVSKRKINKQIPRRLKKIFQRLADGQ